jgi:hypothetical protein
LSLQDLLEIGIDLRQAEIDDNSTLLLSIVEEVSRFDISMVDANFLETLQPNQ